MTEHEYNRLRPWIGVDLDGTLAEYHGWNEEIGKPIPLMFERVERWLEEGTEVRIFTARAGNPGQEEKIRDWLEANDLPRHLKITNVKDLAMKELWDDRAVQVIFNTGRRADGKK